MNHMSSDGTGNAEYRKLGKSRLTSFTDEDVALLTSRVKQVMRHANLCYASGVTLTRRQEVSLAEKGPDSEKVEEPPRSPPIVRRAGIGQCHGKLGWGRRLNCELSTEVRDGQLGGYRSVF